MAESSAANERLGGVRPQSRAGPGSALRATGANDKQQSDVHFRASPVTAMWSWCRSFLKTMVDKGMKPPSLAPTQPWGTGVFPSWSEGAGLPHPDPRTAGTHPVLGATSWGHPWVARPADLGPCGPLNASPLHEASPGLTTNRWSIC